MLVVRSFETLLTAGIAIRNARLHECEKRNRRGSPVPHSTAAPGWRARVPIDELLPDVRPTVIGIAQPFSIWLLGNWTGRFFCSIVEQ
jgi:hypothetical protein